MSVCTFALRCISYWKRHGYQATARRAALSLRRIVFCGRMVIFYVDFSTQYPITCDLPTFMEVQQVTDESQICRFDLQEMVSFWNPRLAYRKIKERLAVGASLWLVRYKGRLAGYGWTLRGCTVEPHYWRLTPEDVHLFDFHVFAPYRGRGINPLLVRTILKYFATERQGRAFIEAAEWNQAQLASLTRTPFRRLGVARKSTMFGHAIVWWPENQRLEPLSKSDFKSSSMADTRTTLSL